MTSTVIICAYTLDRWDVMCRAVTSAAEQADAPEVVIVIDHNDELLERARTTWPEHVVVANRFEQGLSGARNTGVFASSTDVMAFLDDDAVAEPAWLAGLTSPFADDKVGITGGFVSPAWLAPRPGWFPDEFLWVVGCSYKGQPTTTTEVRNPIGASMAVRRSVFEDVGMFRAGVGRIGTVPLGGEETELSIRARRSGYTVMFEPSSVVNHEVGAGRGTFKYFTSRCRAEGKSKAIITDVSGSGDALEAERTYVARTLPGGLLRGFRHGITGPDRGDSVGRSCMIAIGLASAGAGYLRALIGRNRLDANADTDVMELPKGAHGTLESESVTETS